MILSQATAVLHQNLMVGIILIAVGFLGMLLQRNRLATVFSLLIWLQGAGLLLAAFGHYQDSRAQSVYFLLLLLFVMIPAVTLAALSVLKPSQGTAEDTAPESISPDEKGAQTGG
ncbi:NADH-quinone oxidoreductase subunit K [Gimesia panareensis]|uniref:NADH:ubiquinone oxidoreductase subunit K n=1 Tax=Gimesia panareensis TaxID=2527978 RepID=A0A518A103_9PLAN|nr:NADH-quinone oxidoreductase subunit K [Gimesia panareensis]QDT25452.1 NADH:ubiquinone oxidoreductase subunit K [Gimesia panareensis]QDU48413.1 NADH:ubiquinone oxidoreductase subunit K [Gimesia panareensis]